MSNIHEIPKVYWHAGMSSGGTLSLALEIRGEISRQAKEGELANALVQCYKAMKKSGYIPVDAQVLSSRDIADNYGKSRQYWEKLLREGKILYRETRAGRITTDLWIDGYLKDKEAVDIYVKHVRESLRRINATNRHSGIIDCSACGESKFSFAINQGCNTNGGCQECGFHIHTTNTNV